MNRICGNKCVFVQYVSLKMLTLKYKHQKYDYLVALIMHFVHDFRKEKAQQLVTCLRWLLQDAVGVQLLSA